MRAMAWNDNPEARLEGVRRQMALLQTGNPDQFTEARIKRIRELKAREEMLKDEIETKIKRGIYG